MPAPGAPKGNKYAVGNSGGKTVAERVARIKAAMREEVTAEMLVKLANRKIYQQLESDDEGSILIAKEFALPVTLKGMIEKKDVTSDGKALSVTTVNYGHNATDQLPAETIPTTTVSGS